MWRLCWVFGFSVGCGELRTDSTGDLLSNEGLYVDMTAKTIASDAIEIQPAFALWSDGAEKRRWMILPPGSVIDTSDMDHWQLPVGTKLFKEFTVDGKRVETRMIERTGVNDYRFAPYLWSADELDAVFTPEGAEDVLNTHHDVPSQETCRTCHDGEPGKALGVSAVQLSAMLEQLPLSNAPHRTFPVPNQALGVLHANCGHCHTENAIGSMVQLRFSIADAGLPIEDTAPYRATVGIALTNWMTATMVDRIVPGDPAASAIYYRMSQRGTTVQMPPLATENTDDEGRRAVWTWIESL